MLSFFEATKFLSEAQLLLCAIDHLFLVSIQAFYIHITKIYVDFVNEGMSKFIRATVKFSDCLKEHLIPSLVSQG